MLVLLLVIALVVLLVLRVPVGVALLTVSVTYFVLPATPSTLRSASQQLISGLDTFPLLAIPMFVLLGSLVNRIGIAHHIFSNVSAILGHVRGSLGYVNVLSSFGFSLVSGNALSDAVAMSKIQVPEMVKRGYPKHFSIGLTVGASLIAPILPPSVPAIVYGVATGVSIGGLFLAGIVPGILIVAALAFYVWLRLRSRQDLKTARLSTNERLLAFARLIPDLFGGVLIIGGILFGLITPTESAVIGIAYFALLGFFRHGLRLPGFYRALVDSAHVGTPILLLIGGAGLFGWILAREQIPLKLSGLIIDNISSPLVFLFAVNVFLLVLGAFLDSGPAILILAPLLSPIAIDLGIDPYHFAVVMIFNLLIGLTTPPIGALVFVTAAAIDERVDEVFVAMRPVWLILLASLLILTFIEPLSAFLPGLLMGS